MVPVIKHGHVDERLAELIGAHVVGLLVAVEFGQLGELVELKVKARLGVEGRPEPIGGQQGQSEELSHEELTQFLIQKVRESY